MGITDTYTSESESKVLGSAWVFLLTYHYGYDRREYSSSDCAHPELDHMVIQIYAICILLYAILIRHAPLFYLDLCNVGFRDIQVYMTLNLLHRRGDYIARHSVQ